jgi:c-di-GMP-binding flagellar brake protein YcgR
MPSGSDKRRATRFDIVEPATIVVGYKNAALPDVRVFTETLDVSRGGVRVRHPTRFIARPGEVFNISSAHIGEPRPARIIQSTAAGLHIAFDAEDPLIDLLGPTKPRR